MIRSSLDKFLEQVEALARFADLEATADPEPGTPGTGIVRIGAEGSFEPILAFRYQFRGTAVFDGIPGGGEWFYKGEDNHWAVKIEDLDKVLQAIASALDAATSSPADAS